MKLQDLADRSLSDVSGQDMDNSRTDIFQASGQAASFEDMKWLIVESRLLDNEQILVVFEKKHLKEARRAYPSMAIYFPPEIEEIRRYKDTPDYPQVLKRVHLVKKEFGGWIIPSTSSLAWKILQAQRRSEKIIHQVPNGSEFSRQRTVA